MKRIYLDWNIFSAIKNPVQEPYISIAKKLYEIKDYVFIPYSSAHLLDLKKGYEAKEPNITYTNKDLDFLSSVCNNFHWFYSEKEETVRYVVKRPAEAFESYKEEDISAESCMDFEKMFEGMEGMEGIGRSLNELLESIQVPLDFDSIPGEHPLKKSLQDIYGTSGQSTSMLTLMKNYGKFFDEINKDPIKYKNLRNGFRESLKLPSDISNWDTDTWERLDKQLSSTLLNKSFTELVGDNIKSQIKDKKITVYDEFLHAFMSLDLVGYRPDGLNKKNTYTNLFNDSQHAFFGLYSDVFVSNDVNTRAKAKALYAKGGAKTEVLSPEEFLQKLNTEIRIIELFNEAPNGLKLDHLLLTRVPNLDGSDYDYRVEYIDFADNQKMLVGTFDLILGHLNFVETKGIGIPHGALKLLYDWIESNIEKA